MIPQNHRGFCLKAVSYNVGVYQQRKPTMIQLVPMSISDFEIYLNETIQEYAAEKIKAGNWSEADGLELSRKEFAQLLPNGVETPDNYLYTLENEDEEAVGILWVAKRIWGGRPVAFVYDVAIKEDYRRRGYAHQAFLVLEDTMREMGMAEIALHVFGHNHAARALYEKLGYTITNINMSKQL